MDSHYDQVMQQRDQAGQGPARLYFAYSTILDRAAFEEWRHQHGYDFFDLPAGTRAEALDLVHQAGGDVLAVAIGDHRHALMRLDVEADTNRVARAGGQILIVRREHSLEL